MQVVKEFTKTVVGQERQIHLRKHGDRLQESNGHVSKRGADWPETELAGVLEVVLVLERAMSSAGNTEVAGS